MRHVFLISVFLSLPSSTVLGSEPILIADFEASNYGDWKVVGKAFGSGPARGTLPGQMHVDGFVGQGLVNSFNEGDDSTGLLTSPAFKLERRFITFLIGGGGWADETCMNLVVDGKVVRTATGPNMDSGGTERLEPAAWDVSEFIGKQAQLVIVDERRGGWGHINVDQIVQTDDRGSISLAVSPIPDAKDVSRELLIARKWLHFPVKRGAKKRVVMIRVNGQERRRFEIELTESMPDWWAPLDVSEWNGEKINVVASTLPTNSQVLDSLVQSDTLRDGENLYEESLRSQLHFSAKRGWLNDPNGLVYYNREYHLFFQHNPYGWDWGNMHWGHATSRDLVHWQEHGEALYPDDLGPMFSGSAVVDWNNSSGFGKKGNPPLVLIYTAAGNPTAQCLAYSNDGRHFTKFASNPVINQISNGNRDPKVFWHEPSGGWVLVLYVELPGKKHSIHFFTSPNLRDWTLASISEGGVDNDKFLFECPDIFELPVDGDTSKKKWVLTAANSEYAIGSFDGARFRPEAQKIFDVRGRGFYAAQTFSDIPKADGRRIQIGWCQAASPGMPFNQLQSIPCELTLRSTPDGLRLHRAPVKEFESLRDGHNRADSLDEFHSELIEIRAEFTPRATEKVEINVRGAKIAYDGEKQEIVVNDYRSWAPLVQGKQNLVVIVDRTMLEIFASDGLIYAPLPFIPKFEDQSVEIKEKSKLTSLEVYKLKTVWTKTPK